MNSQSTRSRSYKNIYSATPTNPHTTFHRYNYSRTPGPKRTNNELQSQLRNLLETCKEQAMLIQNQSIKLKQKKEQLLDTKKKLVAFRYKQFYATVLLSHYRVAYNNQQEIIQQLTNSSSTDIVHWSLKRAICDKQVTTHWVNLHTVEP